MKKLTAMILALAMALSLCACGGTTAPSPTDEQTNLEVSIEAEATEEVTETPEPTAAPVEFEEVTVIDNEFCSIKITGIDEDNMWGYTVKALLENKSADKTYMFSVDSAAINGVQSDPYFASEVAAGKKANEEISFSDSSLSENGITEYTDIELTFRVYDSDDWSADDVAYTTVHVYPLGEDKAETFVREPQASDNTVIDNDSVSIIVIGYETDEYGDYNVNLYLVNKTDKEVMFTADDVSVNGFMVDPYYATTVLPGKCAFSSLYWFESDFEENGITDVEEIEVRFRAYDSNDWSAGDIVNEVVVLNP